MIDFPTIQSTLKLWVSQLSGVGLPFCTMQNEPRVMHNGTLAVLSWVSINGVGVDDVMEPELVEVPTAIIASGGASSASPQTLSGAALNGAIGADTIDPPQPVEITLSASSDWLATTATVLGFDAYGASVTDHLDIPVGGDAVALGGVPLASVVSVTIPAQGGTGGTFTVGLAETLSPRAMTLRKMTLQVSVETQNQDPSANAFTLLEGMRGRAYHPSSTALLRVANLGLIGVESTLQSDYRVDQRWISRCIATMSFNQSDISVDTRGTNGTIESVDVTSDSLEGVDGEPLQLSLQWDHHDIP